MTSLLPPNVVLSDAAARTLAIAMREVADADGAHPQEQALIEAFSEGLDLTAGADLGAFDSPALQEVFLETLLLVAYADGGVSDEEAAVIRAYAGRLGLGDAEISHCAAEVAKRLLSQLAGVRATRAEVVALGEQMGLDRFTIAHVLDADEA